MKKMVVLALCGWMLCGCSRVESDTNSVKEGSQKMTDDVREGFDDVQDDVQRGADDVWDGIEDTFDDRQENRETGYHHTGTKTVPSINQNVRLTSVPSFQNATMGHPYSPGYIDHL